MHLVTQKLADIIFYRYIKCLSYLLSYFHQNNLKVSLHFLYISSSFKNPIAIMKVVEKNIPGYMYFNMLINSQLLSKSSFKNKRAINDVEPSHIYILATQKPLPHPCVQQNIAVYNYQITVKAWSLCLCLIHTVMVTHQSLHLELVDPGRCFDSLTEPIRQR